MFCIRKKDYVVLKKLRKDEAWAFVIVRFRGKCLTEIYTHSNGF